MTNTQQQIKHVYTLHRFHAKGHKRYRDSPLHEAIEDLAQLDRHTPLDDPPLLKLGPDGQGQDVPALTPFVLVLLIGAVVCVVASALIGLASPLPAPQELNSTDRTMPIEVVEDE